MVKLDKNAIEYIMSLGRKGGKGAGRSVSKQNYRYNWQDFKKTPEGISFLSEALKKKKDFKIDATDKRVDPFQVGRLIDPLRTPLPPTNRVDIPEATQNALKALPNGQKLLTDSGQGYIPARRSIENIQASMSSAAEGMTPVPRSQAVNVARNLIGVPSTEQLVNDNQTSGEKFLTAGAKALSLAAVPQAHVYGVIEANKKTGAGKRISETGHAITGKGKVKTRDELGLNDLNAPTGIKGDLGRIGAGAVNLGQMARSGVGSSYDSLMNMIEGYAQYGGSKIRKAVGSDVGRGNSLGDFNFGVSDAGDTGKTFDELAQPYIDKNVDNMKNLKPTYNSDEILNDYGWKRDPNSLNLLRGGVGMAQELFLDPTSRIELGNTSQAKNASREFVDTATRESADNVARNAAMESVQAGADAGQAAATAARVAEARGVNTVADVAASVTGVNTKRFADDVVRESAKYGRDGSALLAADASKIGAAGMDAIDQKIVDNALRRSHEGFGALNISGWQVPGSRQVGRALSEVNQFDILNSLKGGAATGSIADGAARLNPFDALGRVASGATKDNVAELGRDRLGKHVVTQSLGVRAAQERLAGEQAAHARAGMENNIRGQRKFLGIPIGSDYSKAELERAAALAGKHYNTPQTGMLDLPTPFQPISGFGNEAASEAMDAEMLGLGGLQREIPKEDLLSQLRGERGYGSISDGGYQSVDERRVTAGLANEGDMVDEFGRPLRGTSQQHSPLGRQEASRRGQETNLNRNPLSMGKPETEWQKDLIDHSPFWDTGSEYRSNADYVAKVKGTEGALAQMTPDEYFRMMDEANPVASRNARLYGGNGDAPSWESLRRETGGSSIERYRDAMLSGDEFPTGFIGYRGSQYGGQPNFVQEGLHRAAAAKDAGYSSIQSIIERPTGGVPDELAGADLINGMFNRGKRGAALTPEQVAAAERGMPMARGLGGTTPPASPFGNLTEPVMSRTDAAVQAAMADPAAAGLDESLIRRLVEGQAAMADNTAQVARENLLNINPIEGYQPARIPKKGRTKQVQKTLAETYGGEPLTFQPPSRSTEQAATQRLANSRGDILSQIDAGVSPFQLDKEFKDVAARGNAGVLTETNPYRAFEQVQGEIANLSSQEQLLHSLGSAYGTKLPAGAKVDPKLSVVLQDGTVYAMPDGKTAQLVNDVARSGGRVGDTSVLDSLASKTGQVLNPLMTILRPAFTAINTLGNVDLSVRNGYYRALPSSANDLVKLALAGGDTSKVKSKASRDILQLAESVGVVNPMAASPNMILDPAHTSGLLGGGMKNPLNWVAKPNQIANGASENVFRLGVFKEELAKNGGNVRAARQRVDDVMFNYDKNMLTPIEQHATKALPFYNFSRRNIPATAEYFAKHPTRLANLNRIRTNFGNGSNEDQAARLREQPPFLRDQTMFVSGGNKDVAGNDLGTSMTNVRLPSSEILRLMDTAQTVAQGNPTEKFGAASSYARDLVAPQYSMLSSLISGYDEKGNKTGEDSGYGTGLWDSLLSQTPLLGTIASAATKQGKEEIRGGDPSAVMRSITNQLSMLPSTDYNPAAWERTSAIIGNEELKARKAALMNPSAIAKMLGAEPLDVPQDSPLRVNANDAILKQQGKTDDYNKKVSAKNADTEKVYSQIQRYRHWLDGKARGEKSQTNPKPYAASNVYQMTPTQWAILKAQDPKAYAFWKSRWKGKAGANKTDNMYESLSLMMGNGN